MIVAGAAPHRSAKDTPSRDFLVPDNGAFTIGIDAIHRAALVARNENAFSAPERAQNTGVTKVRVHDRVPRTVRFVLPDAGEGPPVVLRKLSRPQDPAGIHFERDNGVAHVRWRIGIVHTGAGVDHFVLQIQRWRRPDGNAGWSPRFRAGLILSRDPGLFLNQVRSPYPISGSCIQRDHAAAKCAALVCGTGCGKRLVSAGDRNVEPPGLELRRAGNHCEWMFVGARFPTEGAGAGIQGVDVPSEVTEVHETVCDSRRNPHARSCGVSPVQTPRFCIERVHRSIRRSHKNLAVDDGGHTKRGRDARESECPF